MNAEAAAFAWAEKRLSLPRGCVTRIDFGQQQEGYCETCEYTVIGVEVQYHDKNSKTKYGFINLGYDSFTSVLEEILEVGK